jgi:hypothetical protein
MTTAAARTAANTVIAAAGLTAVYLVVTTPPLRRLAVRTAEWWLGASVPFYLLHATGRAWVESGRSTLR